MAQTELEKKVAEAAASITTKTRPPSFPRFEDLTPLKFERNKVGLKAAFGFLFVTNVVVISFLVFSDPNSRFSPHHHTNIMKRRQEEKQKQMQQESSTKTPDMQTV